MDNSDSKPEIPKKPIIVRHWITADSYTNLYITNVQYVKEQLYIHTSSNQNQLDNVSDEIENYVNDDRIDRILR
jgi:hypothetical protein